MSDRDDVKVLLLDEEVELTGKRMANGEVRRRVRFPGGVTCHLTESPQGEGWQQAHSHQGLSETYVIIEGEIYTAQVAIFSSGSTLRDIHFARYYRESGPFTAGAGLIHNIFVVPGSRFVTVVHGTPVPNPAAKGNDWWAAPDEFGKLIKDLSEKDIRQIIDGR